MHVPRSYNAAVDFVDRHVAEGRGPKVAFVEDGRTTTYAELADRTSRVAAAIRGLGVEPEQRVMLCLHDTADFVAIFFGAIRAGAVAVPVNTLLTTDDYAFMLEDSRARLLFVSDALLDKVQPALSRMAKAPRVVIVKSPAFTGPRDVAPSSGPSETRVSRTTLQLEFEATIAATKPSDEVADDDVRRRRVLALLVGLDGRAEGRDPPAVASRADRRALRRGACSAIREDDVVFSAAKLFFAYGLGNAMTFPLHVGATAVLMAERPTPAAVMRTLAKHKPTIFCGVPTLFASILADRSLADVEGLAEAAREHLGGRGAPEAHGRELARALRHRHPRRHRLDGDAPHLPVEPSRRRALRHLGQAGARLRGEARRRRGRARRPTARRARCGCVVRRAASRTGTSARRASRRSTAPWTRTGDRYVRDEDGYYTYAGRSDDMLKVGGIWVSPFEVESALSEHEAVLEAAVVGHADADGLVKPRAFVVLAEGHNGSEALVAELQAFVKAKLAMYKYPRWVEFVSELPKTATGKIQRYKLRA